MLNTAEIRTMLELSFKEYNPFVTYENEKNSVLMIFDTMPDITVSITPFSLPIRHDTQEFYTVYFENEEGQWVKSCWEIENVIAYIRKRIRKTID